MPHVLEASTHLSGAGVWTPVGNADCVILHVTDLGNSREMDQHAPSRLFGIGWIAFGATDIIDGTTQIWMPPLWIEWEHCIWNASAIVDMTTVTLGIDHLRYELYDGAEADILVYTFT